MLFFLQCYIMQYGILTSKHNQRQEQYFQNLFCTLFCKQIGGNPGYILLRLLYYNFSSVDLKTHKKKTGRIACD